ncbi:DUF1800 domain-containing protein [Nocardioides sp. 616]|uniref:DUF1800 domain-containing protein n=1 Tax=Nocardioides sp. 616 TaxID=2268090 RepID=UPI000CE5508D|nr:DUF1800 domain-containing protein [Nocardioides sp. 616]
MSMLASRRAVIAGASVAVGVSAIGPIPTAFAADYMAGSWPATPLLPELDRHLISRFSYAVTPELAQQVSAAGGARAWFDQQLATAYDGSADNLADWWPHLHLRPTAVWKLQMAGTRAGYRVMYDYGRRLLVRRLISPKPVLEVMQEFWENYLNVSVNGDSQFTWRARYGDVIRKHALGRFDQMLQEAITHPAMLIYLDGANSTKDHPSENLARELLELHTVGVGAFRERDVKAAARLLTGYRIADRDDWTYSYDRSVHATGKVRVLGFKSANKRRDGRPATRKLLRYLARHPKTARRIAHRLAVTFVGDNPSPALVDRLAKVYRANGTAIKPVLQALVDSPEFAAAGGLKVRDPSQDVVATFAVLGAQLGRPEQDDISGASLIVHMAETVGLAPMAWPLPDGSPQASSPWTSPARMMASFDMHWRMATRSQPNRNITYRMPEQWLPAPSIALRDLVDHMSRVIHHRPSTATLLQACCEAVEMDPGEIITASHPLVTFFMPRLLVVFLDHPAHLTR